MDKKDTEKWIENEVNILMKKGKKMDKKEFVKLIFLSGYSQGISVKDDKHGKTKNKTKN